MWDIKTYFEQPSRCVTTECECRSQAGDASPPPFDLFRVMEPFQLGDVPPPLSYDPLFTLGTSTVYLATESPHEIGNVLVKALSLLAEIKKINRHKFTIVAMAGDETPDGVCKLKVIVYALGSDAYAVEFQRRAGDCVLYCALFKRIKYMFALLFAESESLRVALGPLVPPAPVLGPSPSPKIELPSLELPESAFDVMAANVFESWPVDEVRGFECAHEELWTRVRHGRAGPAEFGEHLRKIPKPLVAQYSLKVQPCRRGRSPANAEVLCEKIDLMIAEAVAFWETHL